MAASFTLVLDTAAPNVEFGTPATVGENLVVDYAINEPSPESAEVILPNGTSIPGSIGVDKVTFPLGTNEWAYGTIVITTVDDVGNRAERRLVVPPPAPVQVITGYYVYSDGPNPKGMTVEDWIPDAYRYAQIPKRR